MGFILFLLLYILNLFHAHVMKQSNSDSLIVPVQPKANSVVFILKSGNYSIHNGNHSSCRFGGSYIPCECLLAVSDTYSIEENGVEVTRFSVELPDIQIAVPLEHEMLEQLSVVLTSKLCIPERFQVELLYRAFEVLPPGNWSTVAISSVFLHSSSINISFPCEHFVSAGFYKIRIVSSHGYDIESDNRILVNESTRFSLEMRNDSIFPHCVNDLSLRWKTAKCDDAALNYHIRVLAIPEGERYHSHRSHYIEDVSLSLEQTTLKIGCYLFDIFYEKYCFELLSIDVKSDAYHLWRWSCVNTEPAVRANVKWTGWSAWSECSSTCGESVQKRHRYCENSNPNENSGCEGKVFETRACLVPDCSESSSAHINLGNCTCGCEMVGTSGFFFATAAHAEMCDGNQTWYMAKSNKSMVSDFKVSADVDADGKLFFFVGAPYKELVWFSGSNQEQDFSLSMNRPIFVVLWYKKNNSVLESGKGFNVAYSTREALHQISMPASPPCHPFCQENLVIASLAILFILILFIPPFVCASVTRRLREHSIHKHPLIDKACEGEMIRSGNTDCTQVSEEKAACVAHKSVGIQLSVQNTPRLLRPRFPADSPLPCGTSSLSTTDELEYDYYDGTTIPGSLLAPLNNRLLSEIDLSQIIGQSILFSDRPEEIDKHDQR